MDDPPVDGFDLAEALDLVVRHVPGAGGRLDGRVIKLGTNVPEARRHFILTHECGHYVLKVFGPLNDEEHANYLGAALLVPRRALLRALRAGWDLQRLRCIHLNASAELLARRVIEVRREGSAAIYDQGVLSYRYGLDVHPLERELAAEALALGTPIRVDACTGAWPIFIGYHKRVIVMAGPRALDQSYAA